MKTVFLFYALSITNDGAHLYQSIWDDERQCLVAAQLFTADSNIGYQYGCEPMPLDKALSALERGYNG